MTNVVILVVAGVVLGVSAYALFRWREERQTRTKKDAATAREQRNVDAWEAKERKRSHDYGNEPRKAK